MFQDCDLEVWRCVRSYPNEVVYRLNCVTIITLVKELYSFTTTCCCRSRRRIETCYQNLNFGEPVLELQIGVASEALELSFVARLILIKLRIADAFELFLWQRVVGFCSPRSFDGTYGLKSLQIAKKHCVARL